MSDDPNPINWPPRAFWAEVAQLPVSLEEALASEFAAGPDSQEVEAPASRESRLRDYSDPAPTDWLTVPPAYFRQRRAWAQFQREWYAQIGETPEQNEYQVEPERKGGHTRSDGSWRGHRVMSLDVREFDEESGEDEGLGDYLRDDALFPGEDPEIAEYEPSGDEEYDEFVEDLRTAAGLTKGEAAAAAWIVRGNQVFGADYAERLGDSLGVSHPAAKQSWYRARKKLIEVWGSEPEAGDKPPRKQYVVGAGKHPFTPEGPRRLTQFDTLED